MSKQIFLIKQLLEYLDAFESEAGNKTIKDFSMYLNDRMIREKTDLQNSKLAHENQKEIKLYPQNEFSTQLTTLFRFVKHYMKKGLKGSPINTIDEFGFMSSLYREENMLKKDLINEHNLEISSGSEIIKRLIKKELLTEFPDEKVRRAKKVLLSVMGRKHTEALFENMHKVSRVVTGKISSEELINVLGIFDKLNYFHYKIDKEDRQSDLDDILMKYIVEGNIKTG